MNLLHFIESDVIVEHSIKCCGCGCVVHAHPPNDLQGFLADLEMSWKVIGDKPQPFCRACSEPTRKGHA